MLNSHEHCCMIMWRATHSLRKRVRSDELRHPMNHYKLGLCGFSTISVCRVFFIIMVVGDENTNESIDVDGETIDKVNSFKYLGAIKTSTGSCSEDVKARIGRVKKATMELDTIGKDRGIRKELKMKLAKALIWKIEQHAGKEVVRLERLTSEMTTPTKVK